MRVFEETGQGNRVVVVPVLEENWDLCGVQVLVRVLWVADDEGTAQAIEVLVLEVRVPPVGAYSGHHELVDVGVSREDLALGHTCHTVHVTGTVLHDAVPVD